MYVDNTEWERATQEIAVGPEWQHYRLFLKFRYHFIPSSYRYYYSHFRNEETEAQGGETICTWRLLAPSWYTQPASALREPVCHPLPATAISTALLRAKDKTLASGAFSSH